MKKMKPLLCIAGIVTFLMFSCEKVSVNSSAELVIKASALPTLKSATAGLAAIVLDTFLINIEDIQFKFDESNAGFNRTDDCNDADCDDCDDDDCNDDKCNDAAAGGTTYDDIKAEGPYLINILSPEVLSGMVLDRFSIPNAIYDKIEFDLARYIPDDNKQMQGHSVYLSGTINGNRFQLWTNKDKEIEIEFPDSSLVNLTGENIRLYIDISLGKIKSNLEAMNLDAAVDGNKNGFIEIGTDDPDGNQALSYSLLNAIAGCFDLDDKHDNDDCDNDDCDNDDCANDDCDDDDCDNDDCGDDD
jgi:hypothetical protein